MATRTALMGKGLVGLWLMLFAATFTACAAPQFTYVANSDAHAYFKVPNRWHKIDDSSLSTALNGGNSAGRKSGVWSVGFDAAGSPTASHVFSARTAHPFVFALVGRLTQTASSTMSYNQLRDFFLPVTSTARQDAAQRGFPLTGFQLLRNAVLTPGHGVHGVRVTYQYTYPDGSTDTFDQVAFTNADNTEVYLLMVHCLSSCYSHDRNEINTVMTSFTVRSQ